MMKSQIKIIDNIIFEYPLWVEEFFKPANITGTKEMTAAGTYVAYEVMTKTPTITLVSKDSGWLSEQNIEDLKALWSLTDNSFLVTYIDDTTEKVIFDRSIPLAFDPIYEGACYYYANIGLIKVNT